MVSLCSVSSQPLALDADFGLFRRISRVDRHRAHRRRDLGRCHKHRGRFVRWGRLEVMLYSAVNSYV